MYLSMPVQLRTTQVFPDTHPNFKYQNFSISAQSFNCIHTIYASVTGIRAILEQSGHVITYASRTLSGSEKN